MSQSNNSPYFTQMTKSASPAVLSEIKQMERSRQNSFASLKTVMNQKYGLPEAN